MFTQFHRNALFAGLVAALIVILAIYIGSQQLKHFDRALTVYALGAIIASFAAAYRYAVWAQRPATFMYMKRGWHLYWLRWRNTPLLGKRLVDNFVLQKFIANRSSERWMMHACLSWGGILAFALTFPLVFGWIHFETPGTNAEIYRVFVLGFQVEEFSIHSLRAILHFNLLNISAILVLIGTVLAFRLRITDKGEIAIQSFRNDILPLLLLFIVSTTGLMLTLSSNLMAGLGFQVIAIAHAASVIGLLLYIPFGKLSHIVQRPLALAVGLYRDAGRCIPAICRRCGHDYASQMHVDDLKTVLDQLGYNFWIPAPQGDLHYQDICPPCRRRLFALNQAGAVGR